MVDRVGAAVQHKRRKVQHGGRIERLFVGSVVRVARGVAPAVAVRVQGDIGPVGVVERLCGCQEFFFRVPAGRRPGVPHDACERAVVVAHGPFAARCGHVPVVPVVASLRQAERLIGSVGAIAHREHGQMTRHAWAQAAGVRRGAGAPVVADQRRLLQAERIDKLQQVAPERRQLAGARCVVTQEPGRRETTQRRHQDAPARLRQHRTHAGPAAGTVGPAVQQHHGACCARVPVLVPDAQEGSVDGLHRALITLCLDGLGRPG